MQSGLRKSCDKLLRDIALACVTNGFIRLATCAYPPNLATAEVDRNHIFPLQDGEKSITVELI